MSIRTYIRIIFNDLFRNNFLANGIVNLYYKIHKKPTEEVKFSFINPINKKDEKRIISFQSVTGDKIDCR